MTWEQVVVDMKSNGSKWFEIAIALKEHFPELTDTQRSDKARNYYRSIQNATVGSKSSQIDVQSNVIDLLTKGITLDDLSNAIKLSKSICVNIIEDIKSQGYNVQEIGDTVLISKIVVPRENVVKNDWNGEKIIRFALMGDTQINSKYTQLTHLHKFYEICKEEGIETIYHTGDIDEGEQMRMGHQYECYNQGAKDHIDEIVRVYPQIDGITTHFITGNHDASFIKRCGLDIGYEIADKRKDMIYLGQSMARINLTPSCSLELRHPIDGTAYALSYKIQKMIEAMSGGEKPNIIAVGHYHKAEYFMFRNVMAFQTGCFQSATPFTLGKNISVFMGGWIVEAHVNDEGTITRLKQEYIPFYKAIPDDWKNWR